LSFQDGTSLSIPSSQISLLREKLPNFKSLWSGIFQETLQTPLALTQKEFTYLLNCLLDVHFKIPLEEIPSLIQRVDYYQLTKFVRNLEEQLFDGCKLQNLKNF
jgi:hypothetical protein